MMNRSERSRGGQLQRSPSRGGGLTPWFSDWGMPVPRWLDEFFEPGFLTDNWVGDRFFAPAVDVDETDNEYIVRVDLPGVAKSDISVDCAGDQISISATRKEESREGGRAGRRERFYGTYKRTFSIPSDVEQDRISADYGDGVLRLTLPKGESARRRQIPIGETIEAQGKSTQAH